MGLQRGGVVVIVNANLLRSWSACWSDERIAAHRLASGATPRQIAADESISIDERPWVVTRCLWHLDESAARYYAIERARTVTHFAGDEDDQAQHAAILDELARIESEVSADQRDAAWDAAWATAWVAARDAARDAARAAAWDAARAAAWDAAWAAAGPAAWAAGHAARAAARAAARDAAWAAALDAARELAPTVDELRAEAHRLVDRMLAVTE